jgi:DNA-binding phage protein
LSGENSDKFEALCAALDDLTTEDLGKLAQALRARLEARIGADPLLASALYHVPGSYGLLSVVAKRCGVSRAHLYAKLKSDAWGVFRWALEAEREEIADAAEATLITAAISNKNLQAAQFLLLNIGRNRGYGPQAVEQPEAMVVVDKRRREAKPKAEEQPKAKAEEPKKAAGRGAGR